MNRSGKIFLTIIVFIFSILFSDIKKYEGLIIEDIVVEGNKLPDRRYIGITGIEKGDPVNIEDISKGFKELYTSGMVKQVIFDISESGNGKVILTIKVDEFPKVKKITINGNKEYDEDELQELIPLKLEEYFSESALKNSVEAIKDKYREDGFLMTRVEEEVIHDDEKNAVEIIFEIFEGSEVLVEEIKIFGISNFTEKNLKKQMDTEENRWYRDGKFNEATFEADKTKLIDHYNNYGYINARILKTTTAYRWNDPSDKKAKDIYIKLWIEEGEQYFFGTIAIKGNVLFEEEEIRKWFKRKEGEIYSKEIHENDIQYIRMKYNEKGYIFNRVTPIQDIDEETKRINYVLEIYEGDKAHIENIIIEGLEKTMPKVVQRELEVREGEIFNAVKIRRSVEKLMNLQYFETVMPDAKPGSTEGLMNLIFRIKEQRTGMLSAGGGYSTTAKFSVFAEVRKINFLGRGQSIGSKVEWGQTKQSITFNFTEPWLLDKPISAGVDTSFNNSMKSYDTEVIKEVWGRRNQNKTRTYEFNYTQRDASLGLSLGYRFYNWWYVSYRNSFSIYYYLLDKRQRSRFLPDDVYDDKQPDQQKTYRRFSDLQQVVNINENSLRSPWQKSLSLSFRVGRDSRNNSLNPSRGSDLSQTVEYILIDQNLTKWNTHYATYYSPVWKLVLAYSSDFYTLGEDVYGRMRNYETEKYYFLPEELRGCCKISSCY